MILALLSVIVSVQTPPEKLQMGMRAMCLVESKFGGSKGTIRRGEHQAFADKLYRDGKLEMEGPLQDSQQASFMVFKTEKIDEAKELLKTDPGISSGDLAVTFYQWYFPVSAIHAAPDPEKREKLWFGMLVRPDKAPPKLTDDAEKKLQDGHMANINAMAKTGDLVLAGPLEGDQAFQGIFIFRVADPRHIGDLVKSDPLISSGQLGLHLYQWLVPAGILPAKL